MSDAGHDHHTRPRATDVAASGPPGNVSHAHDGAPTSDCEHDHAHGHAHDHDHGHGSGHVHAPANFGRAFAIGIALNTGFVLVEVVYGVIANSVALLADAGHNLGDVLGLTVAWIAATLVRRKPSARFTYGLRGSSILAAVFNAVFLLVSVGAISWEAIQRLGRPEPVAEVTVMVVAAVGILVNGVTAWLFASGGRDDINLRGAFLHMAGDALISAGVVVAGFVILVTGWLWLDPVVSLTIGAIIIWGTWHLLRESIGMSLAAVPLGIDPAAVRAFLHAQPGIVSLHDLHVWPMSTTETALTCHVVMPAGHPGDAFLKRLSDDLATRFGIGHATVQIEMDTATVCSANCDLAA